MIYHYNCHIQIPSRIYGNKDIDAAQANVKLNLDTFKDIWGPWITAHAMRSSTDLDTFKDIWGLRSSVDRS